MENLCLLHGFFILLNFLLAQKMYLTGYFCCVTSCCNAKNG